jgi:hypothetical protein
MARRPGGDLGSMAISKVSAAETVPFGASQPASSPTAVAAISAVKSLTVKLPGDLYAELRTYCYEHERSTGTKLTHQDAMVSALKTLLATPR